MNTLTSATDDIKMNPASLRCAVALAAVLAVTATPRPALAQAGSANEPVVVRMERGADTVRLQGRLQQGRDCCAYRFTASAGQRLVWHIDGPAVSLLFTMPGGDTDGPDLPPEIDLPASGDYLLQVSPNTRAEHAFGPFTLTLTLTPLRAATLPPQISPSPVYRWPRWLVMGAADFWASANPVPAREPGLWEMTKTEGVDHQTITLCATPTVDRQMWDMLLMSHDGRCTRQGAGQTLIGGTVVDMACSGAGMEVTSHVELAPVAASGYTQREARVIQNTAGSAGMTVQGRWLGACPADWKPGDMSPEGTNGRVKVDALKAEPF